MRKAFFMMQNRWYFLFFLGFLQLTFGQHLVEKSVDVRSKNIEISCRNIDHLQLRSTSNKTVKINLTDAQDRFTNIDVYYENDKLIIKQKESQPQETINKFCVEQPIFASYIISVPNDSQVFINIISGNLNISHFKGFINAQLETGNVILENNTGEVNLKIVDGSVNSVIKNSQLNLTTNLGEIESKLPHLPASKNKKSLIGFYKNDQNKLSIKAIKANIAIEAAKD